MSSTVPGGGAPIVTEAIELAAPQKQSMSRMLSPGEAKLHLKSLVQDYLRTSDVSDLSDRIRGISVSDTGSFRLEAPSNLRNPQASSRAWLTAELAKQFAYAVCSGNEEEGEKLCSALVQLSLCGVLSPLGLEHGMRVMAARLSDVVLDHPMALTHLTGFSSWLAQSETISEQFLDEATLQPGLLRATLEDALAGGVEDPVKGRAGMATLASALSAALHSRMPTQLAQLRAMYKEAIHAYLASGGGGLEVAMSTLASLRARWTSHELVRKLIHAFVDPPFAELDEGGPTCGGGGGSDPPLSLLSLHGLQGIRDGDSPPSLPPWLVRELCVDLFTSLLSHGHIDTYSVSAACEAALRELPELTLDVPDAPLILGALFARLVSEGVLGEGFIDGKHAALGGASLSEECVDGGARASSSSSFSPVESDGATAIQQPDVGGGIAGGVLSALTKTPALGPLPRNSWAAGTTATRSCGSGCAPTSPTGSGWESQAPLVDSGNVMFSEDGSLTDSNEGPPDFDLNPPTHQPTERMDVAAGNLTPPPPPPYANPSRFADEPPSAPPSRFGSPGPLR